MKVVKFRIKNYKSITDSGDCYFSEQITILAGKNESGKTSVLEALEDFHEDRTIREEAKPLNSEENPEVSITFELSPSEIKDIFADLEIKISIKENINITLTKKYGSTEYFLDDESKKLLNFESYYVELKEKIIEISTQIKEIAQNEDFEIPQIDGKKIEEYLQELNAFQTHLARQHFQNNDAKLHDAKKIIIDTVEYFSKKTTENFVEKFIEKKLPYFILFSSFEDEFPSELDIKSIKENEWAKDLEVISKFNIDSISSEDPQKSKTHEKSVNVDFGEKFKKFWTQDEIKLEISKDGEKINFWIAEDDKLYYPKQRSKGQQWYLSFYIKIVARINEGKPNVILIDEPGLYLHAKAQKDLLEVLNKHSSNYPIVFSTHSPYLIEVDNLESVRLVEKINSQKGSVVLGKVHAHSKASKETLTPILTAIGLGMNDSITNLEQADNVIVEGPSDVFYLQAFKKMFPEITKVNFINGGGALNMGVVGAILEGWGSNVVYLFDNDSGKKQGVKKLASWKVLDEQIKDILDNGNTAIEDIFTIDDFKTYVLENSALLYNKKNSEHMKGKDKVLTSRKFLQSLNGEIPPLSEETKVNIKNLLKKFNNMF